MFIVNFINVYLYAFLTDKNEEEHTRKVKNLHQR